MFSYGLIMAAWGLVSFFVAILIGESSKPQVRYRGGRWSFPSPPSASLAFLDRRLLIDVRSWEGLCYWQ